jgi:methylglyoxal synthase
LADGRYRLQLPTATSLQIGANYEEMFDPVIDEFIFLCDPLYAFDHFAQIDPALLRTI